MAYHSIPKVGSANSDLTLAISSIDNSVQTSLAPFIPSDSLKGGLCHLQEGRWKTYLKYGYSQLKS